MSEQYKTGIITDHQRSVIAAQDRSELLHLHSRDSKARVAVQFLGTILKKPLKLSRRKSSYIGARLGRFRAVVLCSNATLHLDQREYLVKLA